MARSLSKIHEQIAKLQKEAASIQTTVIARLKREIAQHGLTVEHLFGATESTYVGNGRRTKAGAASAKKAKTDKPAKFADGQGNFWHGVGKRPAWIHTALAAGRSLEDFLVSKSATPAAGAAAKDGNESPQARRGRKKAAPAKKAAKAAAAAKPARRAPAKKASAAPVAAKKKAKPAAKKAPVAKRAAKASKRAAPAEKVAEQPTA